MRILQISPFQFRAFCDLGTIDFNKNLTIFYGGNGTGKSSLSEAVEWILYGYTKRRRKGDEYSKNEYKGSYVHNACPPGVAPYVEAKVELSDGSIHLLRRTIKLNKSGLPLDQDSLITVDGHAYQDFTCILPPYTEAHSPVIVQHGIQDFIHSKPIDRYRVISEALGLSELVEFKDVLDRAKTQRRNNPSPTIIQAKRIASQLIPKLQSVGLNEVANRWQSEAYSPDDDFSKILSQAQTFTGSSADTLEDVLLDVRSRQVEAIDKVFDISPFRPSPNLLATLDQLPALLTQLTDADRRFKEAAVAYAGATASRYRMAQLDFWQEGLNHIDAAHPEQCPFCEETTLTPAKVDTLRARLGAEHSLSQARTGFDRESAALLNALVQLETQLPVLEFASVSSDSMSALQRLFTSDLPRLQAFLAENRLCAALVSSLRKTIVDSKSAVQRVQSAIAKPEDVAAAAAGAVHVVSNVSEAIAEAASKLRPYHKTFTEFRPLLERELADEATVSQYTSFVAILPHMSTIRLLATHKEFEAELLEVQRLTEQYVLNQQQLAVAKREVDILTWYGLLSPNADIRFSGLEPGKNEFILKAEAFGRTMNAAASLSHSQLNCLGLSIYIPSVCSSDCPFTFVLFDDPVQAMDDDHHESFLLRVVPELLDINHVQLIVLTHLVETANRLREGNFTRDFTYYRLDKLRPSGPVIVENVLLSDDMNRIRTLAEGNDAVREVAVDRIRVACENIMREAYLRHNMMRMPVVSGTWHQMMPYFIAIPAVTAAVVTELQDTINWSNPAHHTQQGYIVPSRANIFPHIERLQRIINGLGLKS